MATYMFRSPRGAANNSSAGINGAIVSNVADEAAARVVMKTTWPPAAPGEVPHASWPAEQISGNNLTINILWIEGFIVRPEPPYRESFRGA